jgi:hypothetical protein
MPVASEIEPVTAGFSLWQVYDPAVKADLFSTAVETDTGIFLVDPVPLAADALARLRAQGRIAGVVVTNENHLRAADTFADQFDIPIFVHPTVMDANPLPRMQSIRDPKVFGASLSAIDIDGGPPGEIAIYSDAEGGSLVVGDALINFEPYGFALLPAKYCSNPRMMRRSLAKLLDYSFQKILFAHGTPILTDARECLERLLFPR